MDSKLEKLPYKNGVDNTLIETMNQLIEYINGSSFLFPKKHAKSVFNALRWQQVIIMALSAKINDLREANKYDEVYVEDEYVQSITGDWIEMSIEDAGVFTKLNRSE